MNEIFYNMEAKGIDNKFEENLFVKNIIVNKDKRKKQYLPFIATEKWIDQLGNRLQINS